MTKLSSAQIDRELNESLDGWKHEGDFIKKEFEFKTFMAGIQFVNDVAKIAEQQEHHPDIHIRWTTITLMIQSHEEGGVTDLDVQLAREIEKYMHKKSG